MNATGLVWVEAEGSVQDNSAQQRIIQPNMLAVERVANSEIMKERRKCMVAGGTSEAK